MASSLSAREMQGSLFQYARGLQAFESGPPGASKKLIQLGGLSDGLLSCDYVPLVGAALAAEGWSLVQPVLRSSYLQFGFGSLDNDVEDLRALLTTLKEERGCEQVAVCGHSTGSQIAAHLVASGRDQDVVTELLRHVVFQAGCSDRESDDASAKEHQATWLPIAKGLPGDAFLDRGAMWAPITASRYLALNERLGADDYFSSDLTDQELAARLNCCGQLSALVAFSGADEYMPPSVDKLKLAHRLCAAMSQNANSTKIRHLACVVPDGTHALDKTEPAKFFVKTLVAFLTDKDHVPGCA